MFLLSLLLVTWTISIMGGVIMVFFSSILARRFMLQQASFVVASFHPDPDSIRSVDVTVAVRGLGTTLSKKVKLISFLREKASRGDLREALDSCREIGNEMARIRRSPICFLDIRYKMGSFWRTDHKVHRCLYPIYSFSDFVHYPPTPCSWASWWWWRQVASSSSHKGMESAILTLRSTNAAGHSMQMACHVTPRMKQLEGPFGDFHGQSNAGFQLRKHILRVVLMPDIAMLIRAMEGGGGGGGGEEERSSSSSAEAASTAEAASSSASAAALDASTNSLKSLYLRPSASLRLHIKSDHRNKIIVL